MAKTVDFIPSARKGSNRFDYDELFDGRLRELSSPDDFQPEDRVHVIANTIRSAMKNRKLEGTVAVRGDKIYVEAKP